MSNSAFQIKWSLTQAQSPSGGQIISVLVYLRIDASRTSWPQVPQITSTNIWKVIQSVKLRISHEMKAYSSIKTIWGLSYNCVSVFWNWGKSGKWDPNTPNHACRYTEDHPKSWTPHFTSNKALLKSKDYLMVDLYLFYFIWGNWSKLEKLGPNTPRLWAWIYR